MKINRNWIFKLGFWGWLSLNFWLIALPLRAQVIDFESGRWELEQAQIVDYLGRRSLIGYAQLKETTFTNGVIEVDVAVDGRRSYPGILFRMIDDENYERFYIRPHRMPLYADVLQYVPGFNGVDSWQLYSGEGFTANAAFPVNQWTHLKIEVLGTQARVFLNAEPTPALEIHHLLRGLSSGTLALMAPADRSCYFSNFKYHATDTLDFIPAPPVDSLPGAIQDWEISTAFKMLNFDLEHYPAEKILKQVTWQKVTCTPNGSVDLSRFLKRGGREPECVLARIILKSDRAEVKKFNFGYSDAICIYLNRQPIFTGSSAYQERDPSFLGIMGLFDTVYLPLRKGENELFLVITEFFGGWGWIFQDGTAVIQHPQLTKVWATGADFPMPESVTFDPKHQTLFVSSYDGYHPSYQEGKQSIAKISLAGKVENLAWVTGLANPTGMVLAQDRLWVVERQNLVVIDPDSGKIVNRIPIPAAKFLNDIAVAPDGAIYISDSNGHVIFQVTGEVVTAWAKDPEIKNPNGLWCHDNALIFANNGDRSLKAIDLTTKKIRRITRLPGGIIDGIAADCRGNWLVTQNEGRLYRISPTGKVQKLLDTTALGTRLADFCYIPEVNLLVIPTFLDNRVIAYRLK